ncbi:MAG: DUF420 domain-containing protein [Acidobacteriota bacterium]|nr:DUF420 domain-containing protein [Acidobacteriota bacterium]
MIEIQNLPALNASLNGTSGVLLILGYIFIRQRKLKAHAICMLGAFFISILFLISYLVYHYFAGSTAFLGEGWIRSLYFSILISHIVLAIVIVPLAIVTVARGLKENFDKHRSIARWTLPLWLYVSVTGVIIYLMLYQSGYS